MTGELSFHHRWRNLDFSGGMLSSHHYSSDEYCFPVETDDKACKDILNNKFCVGLDDTANEIQKIKSLAEHNIQPLKQAEYDCVVLMVERLAYPEWISINCSEPLMREIFCQPNNSQRSVPGSSDQMMPFCSAEEVLFANQCISFTYIKKYTSCQYFSEPNHRCKLNFMLHLTEVGLHKFKPLLTSLDSFASQSKPFLFFKFKRSKCEATLVYRMHHKFVDSLWNYKSVSCCAAHGTAFCHNKLKIFSTGVSSQMHTFICKNKEIISHTLLCDGKPHCGQREDEQNCNCFNTKNKYRSLCVIQCNFHNCENKQLYWPDRNRTKISPTFFTCSDGQQIYACQVNDGYPDCLDQMDEVGYMLSVKKYMLATNLCKDPTWLQCYEGFAHCFHLSKLCVHEVDDKGDSTICRNGFHLSNCTNFQCNALFKCPDSHCVPYSQQCDGQWQCPLGDDEVNCTKRDCSSFFKCWESTLCIHIADICNDKADCPFGDEELLCEIQSLHCPKNCHCFNLAIFCENISRHYFQANQRYTSKCLFIYLKYPVIEHSTIKLFSKASHITLMTNNMTLFCLGSSAFPSLLLVNFSMSSLSKITRNCFVGFSNLTMMILYSLGISQIETESFSKQNAVIQLDLSNNSISKLRRKHFVGLGMLACLSIRDNPITQIESDLYKYLSNLKRMDTDYFAVCCSVSNGTLCNTKPQWPMSCSDILGQKAMKICLILTVVLIFLLSFISCLCFHVKIENTKMKRTSYDFTVLCVNICDMLCGIYLIIVLAADSHYSGVFFTSEFVWRSHGLCHFGSVISAMFCTMSPAVLNFLAISRLLVVLYPMNVDYKSFAFVRKYIFGIICFSTATSLLVWLLYYFAEGIKSLTLPLCSLVGVTEGFLVVKTFTLFVSVLLIVCSITILIFNICLLCNLKKESAVKKKSKLKTKTLVQIIVVTTSNLLCWIPSSIIYILSFALIDYSTNLLVWTITAVVPINSIVNPIVFNIMNLKEICKSRNWEKKC